MRIADLHCDTLLELQAGADLAHAPHGHVDLPRLRRGGVGLQVFVAVVSTTFPAGRAVREAHALLDLLDEACDRHQQHVVRVTTADEAERAAAGGRIAAMPALENGHAIEEDLSKLEALARRGIRYMTLTHSRHLAWAASSGEAGDGPGGLTAFGREVVAALHALGIVVDVSHVHERTFWDVVRIARKPVIASHSNAMALCRTSRNLEDDQIRAIADTGGLVGINFYPGFLDAGYHGRRAASAETLFAELERVERENLDDARARIEASRRLYRQWIAEWGPAEADVERVCDHVEHVAQMAGSDGVAFGSDFDGIPEPPRDLPGCDAFPLVLERLRGRGWDDHRLRKLAWENPLRVLRASE